jgi:UDP-glucose 4-epimerase
MLLPNPKITKSNSKPLIEAYLVGFGRVKGMSVLVTGGAGYIGSHVVRLLEQKGEKVVVVDDLSEGFQARLPHATLVKLDLAAPDATQKLASVMTEHKVESVIHLAARKKVGESVERPDWYFEQNVGGMKDLLSAMQTAGVMKLVFSSSAATYGIPDVDQVDEDFDCKPINPYGQTKLEGERLAAEASKDWGLRQLSLRYFNVAGTGWPDLVDTQVANLVPIIFKSIQDGSSPQVFGTDWPTPDGSCVRDYVHVLDLAEAHIAALEYLDKPEREYQVFNVGTGQGSSVLDVIHEVAAVTGLKIEPDLKPRRAGDPAYLCADVSRIEKVLGWKAKHNLTDIISSVWKAQQN